MGLDIRIRKIRRKYFDDSVTAEEVFKNENSTFVAEFRNVWDWVNKFNPTDEEDDNGCFYRYVTKSRVEQLVGDNETKRLKGLVKDFDFNKFIYTVEFDY